MTAMRTLPNLREMTPLQLADIVSDIAGMPPTFTQQTDLNRALYELQRRAEVLQQLEAIVAANKAEEDRMIREYRTSYVGTCDFCGHEQVELHPSRRLCQRCYASEEMGR